MQADCCTKQQALLNARTLTWTPTGADKYDPNDEEGWNLLPNGLVLTVDAYVPLGGFPYIATGTNSELYNYRTGAWHSAGSTIVQLWDSNAACGGISHQYDVRGRPGGAAVRRNSFLRRFQYLSRGAGNTAIYNTKHRTVAAGPGVT